MSLFSSCPFSQDTVYRIDFTAKSINGPKPRKACERKRQENPLSAPYSKAIPDKIEDMELFRLKMINTVPAAKKYLIEPLDPLVYNSANLVNTTYRSHFCTSGASNVDSAREKEVSLPVDWFSPMTTQQCSYRHPLIWSEEEITLSKPILPTHNLVPNQKERELLRVKTGDSDYMSQIGRTGSWILENKLHGEIKKINKK